MYGCIVCPDQGNPHRNAKSHDECGRARSYTKLAFKTATLSHVTADGQAAPGAGCEARSLAVLWPPAVRPRSCRSEAHLPGRLGRRRRPRPRLGCVVSGLRPRKLDVLESFELLEEPHGEQDSVTRRWLPLQCESGWVIHASTVYDSLHDNRKPWAREAMHLWG